MAEPKKETVRIALPPRPENVGSAPEITKRDTARIVLPTRAPVTPIKRLPPKITPMPAAETATEGPTIITRRPPLAVPATSPLLQPLPKPPGIENGKAGGIATQPVAPVSDENAFGPSVNRGPKQETARITVLPRPASTTAPTINMTKTQPLLVHPPAGVQAAPVVITSRPFTPIDAISRPLCWTLFAVSAVIFLIQIWNYVVS